MAAYIHFALMYTTYHIFLVLTIKDLINKDGEPTTPFKLVTGTKPSVSYLRVLFCPCVVQKDTPHVDKNVKCGTSGLLLYLSPVTILKPSD